MDRERKMSILRYYHRSFQKRGWVWRINGEWLNRTIDEVKFLEGYLTNEDRILDVGCGTGRHIIELCRKGYQVVGIDLSKDMLTIAKSDLSKEGFSPGIIQADATRLPLVKRFFEKKFFLEQKLRVRARWF
jgi:SAM-dependent methyltransferase